MRKSTLAVLLIILVCFFLGIAFYPQMPDEMASSWDIKGNVKGYLPKFWGLFLVPIISFCILLLLFILLPKIDPLKANIEKFRKYFDTFIVVIAVFFFYIYLLTILWNLGYNFDVGRAMIPALGILFYYCGVLVENAKRNWFIGIRTPWTLSNEEVWEKTHKLGGKLYKIIGLIAFLGVIFPSYALLIILIPVISATIYIIIYSFFEYKKLANNK